MFDQNALAYFSLSVSEKKQKVWDIGAKPVLQNFFRPE
jgi:hypothetical protein